MAELLKRLSEARGVSGNEDGVRSLILNEITEKCGSITVDAMGNIIALKKGDTGGKTIAVTAHMDEAGLIISKITETGCLKFKSVGNIDPRKLISKRVVIGKNNLTGVIGMKAIHLQTRDERKNVVKVKDLFIDIGAKDKETAERLVRLGDYAIFDTDFDVLGNNIKGKALDRSGVCYALIKALEDRCPHDFYAVFTVQHEVGARGARIAAHRLNPDVILTLSSADTADMYGANGGGIKLGNGAAVSLADKSMISGKSITGRVTEAAKAAGVRVQEAVTAPYESDGGAMQFSGAKLMNVVIPCRYSRSPVSLMNVNDINDAADYIKIFLKEMQ